MELSQLTGVSQGLANGFPLSGIVSKTEITDKLKPGIMVIQLFKKIFTSENSHRNNLTGWNIRRKCSRVRSSNRVCGCDERGKGARERPATVW
jgi:hypothetical protein